MTPEAITAIRLRDYFACEDNFIKTKDLPTDLVQGRFRDEPPRFTIVIPTYNKPALLELAVRSALAQSGDDYQILVADDEGRPGEDTGTARLMRSMADERLIYCANRQNLGLFANWNRCFELAQSEWVVMLHDDDLLCENYLDWMRSALAAAPAADLAAVRSSGFTIDQQMTEAQRKELCAAPGGKQPKKLRPVSMAQLQFGPGIVWQGCCIRRSAFLEMGGAQLGARQVGGRPIGAYYGQDYCMMVRFAHRFNCYRLALPLYRVGVGANSSRNVWEWQDALVEQHWCSRFLARQHRFLSKVGILTAQKRILELAESYNSGESYMGVEVGLDMAQLRRDCCIEEIDVNSSMKSAEKLWRIYDKLRMAASHLGDKRLTPPSKENRA